MDAITTLAQLRQQYPGLVKEAEDAAVSAALVTERDRVGAYLPFMSAGPEVAAAITSGKVPTMTEMGQLALKAAGKTTLGQLGADNAEDVEADEAASNTTGKGADKTKEDAFWAEVKGNVNL